MTTPSPSDPSKFDIYQQPFVLPYSAVGPSGRLRPDRLIRLFQDAASQHSHLLGSSGLQLAAKTVKWVVSRYQIQFHAIPRWPDPLVLKTWRRPWKNLYELRHLSLERPDGSVLVSGFSFWILINSHTAKPVRLSKYLPEHCMAHPQESPVELIPNDHDHIRPDFQKRFNVQSRELDMNQHVNNTAYVTWALDPLPLEFLGRHIPLSMAVTYLKETFYQNAMVSMVEQTPTEAGMITRHLITNQDSGLPVARLTFQWRDSHVPV